MALCEVSRFTSIASIGLQRSCIRTTKVGDILIQKGTKVMIDMAEIHRDPELWGPEPVDQFVPERFLPERKAV